MRGLVRLRMAMALGPFVPVLLIPAYGVEETRGRDVYCGAEALLTKPIDFGTLRGKIDGRVESAA
jgi:hypothetical protein